MQGPSYTRRLTSTGAMAVLLVAFASCKPRAGASCKVDHLEICQGKTEALSCNEGAWELLACKGNDGCSAVSQEQGYCDQSRAEVGEACNMDTDYACSADQQSMLRCKSHKWQVVSGCKGPHHCELASQTKRVSCDVSVADTNDLCDVDAKAGSESYACTSDKTGMLKCASGKFILVSTCAGPKNCHLDADKVTCDDSLAKVGDPCDHVTDSYACSIDRTEILRCEGRRFKSYEACGAKKKCDVSGTAVVCRG